MPPLPESWFDKLTMSGRRDFAQALPDHSFRLQQYAAYGNLTQFKIMGTSADSRLRKIPRIRIKTFATLAMMPITNG